MKVVIAGSRTLHHNEPRHYAELLGMIKTFEKVYGKITMVVSGCSTGPDKLGEKWAINNNVHIAKFPANWDLNGKAAGPIRNVEMGNFADAAIVMWDGESKGSKHMSIVMRKLKKPFILDIFEPVVYSYEHQPNGTIKVVKAPKSPSLDDFAYDS